MYNDYDQITDETLDLRPVNEVGTLNIGTVYQVLCFIKEECIPLGLVVEQDEMWMDDVMTTPYYHLHPKHTTITHYIPVLDYPHSDKENGQHLPHYHIDDRFIGEQTTVPENFKQDFHIRFYPNQEPNWKMEHLLLKAHSTHVRTATSSKLISESKLAHNCIHKGKCPHRGYDLTNILPIDGVIKCPMHGLLFDARTKELIDDRDAFVKGVVYKMNRTNRTADTIKRRQDNEDYY